MRPPPTTRRAFAAALALAPLAAQATPETLAQALRGFAGALPQRAGRVAIEIAPLVENGNTVPVTVRVAAPGASVQRIALFAERNPLPEVATFELGARIAEPRVSTRMRLATSQRIVAAAIDADGICWTAAVEVVVTLAACIEG